MSLEWHDLGGGVSWAWFSDEQGPKAGMFIRHPRPDGKGPCEGNIRVRASDRDPSSPVWRLMSEDPLTLHPSVWCKEPRGCGWHVNIVGGRIST